MNPAEAFAGPLCQALIRASWQGGLALLAVWIICRALPKIPPAAKPWLWRIAMLKMLAALFTFEGLRLEVLPPVSTPAAAIVPSSEAPSDVILPIEAELEPVPEFSKPDSPVLLSAAPTHNPSQQNFTWPVLFVTLWLGGVCAGVIVVLRQLGQARALRRGATTPADGILLGQLADLCQRARCRKFPRLLLSAHAAAPLLVGWHRPAIILPARLAVMWTPEKLRMVLAHELAHALRRDLLWIWLAALVQVIFFFHPLAWLARREAILAQESACDELALRLAGSPPATYADMLLDVVSAPFQGLPRLVSAGVAQGKSTLERRITNMKFIVQRKSRAWQFLAAITLAALSLSLVPVRLVAAKAEAPETSPAQPASAPPETNLWKPAPSKTLVPTKSTSEMAFADKAPTVENTPAALSTAPQARIPAELIADLRRRPRGELRHILPTVVADRPLNNWLDDLANAEQEFAALSADYSDEHPEMVKVRSVMAKINEQIEARIDGILAGLELRATHGVFIAEPRLTAAATADDSPARPAPTLGKSHSLYSRTAGQIESVRAQPGDQVTQGQILIQFENAEAMARAQTLAARLKVAESERQIAQAEFEEIQRQHEIIQKQIQVGRAGAENLPNLAIAEATLFKSEAMLEVARREMLEAQVAAMDKYVVRSPVDGVLTQVAEAGQWVDGPGRRLGMVRENSKGQNLVQGMEALEARLKELRAKEAELRLIYTSDHPKLLEVTREIATTEQRLRAEKRATERR